MYISSQSDQCGSCITNAFYIEGIGITQNISDLINVDPVSQGIEVI